METNSTESAQTSVDFLKWSSLCHSPSDAQSWSILPTEMQPRCTSPDTSKRKIFDSPRANVIGAEPSANKHEESHSVVCPASDTTDPLSLSALLDPRIAPDMDTGKLMDEITSFVARCQHSSESLFTSSLSRSLTNSLDKQSGSLCNRILPTEKHLSAGASVTLPSVWDHPSDLWIRSASQELHFSESLCPPYSQALHPLIGAGLTDTGKATNTSGHPISLLDALDTDSGFVQSTPLNNHFTGIDEERRLHCPDGADQPDEHLWLYEDPQGRTQGSFSDAQMNDWLSAGIYFTPLLRIRRKCDTDFSTLAEYTRLFGRTPFTPGPRVPPIRGGIASAIFTSKCSNVLNHDCSDAAAFHSTALTSHMNSNATTSSLDFPSPIVRQSNNLSHSDDHHLTGVKPTAGNVYVNSSLPILSSTTQPPHFSALTTALSTLTLNGHSVNHHNPGSDASNQTVTSASTLMALASLISVNPALASLAMSFSGQTQANSQTDFAAGALAPGFLAALAQYLNVQPPLAGHQSASRMQQLAETAQLAAQLAAMAAAHSPIEPAQALALAELLRSQAQPVPASHWPSQNKRDSTGCSFSDAVSRDTHADSSARNGAEENTDSKSFPDSRGFGTTMSGSFGEDNPSGSQSQWSLPSDSAVTGFHAQRNNDKRRMSTKPFQTTPHGDAFVAPLDHFCDTTFSPSNATSNRRANNLVGLRNGTTKLSPSNESHHSGGSRADSLSAAAAVNGSSFTSLNHFGGGQHASGLDSQPSQQRTTDAQWVNKVKQNASTLSTPSTRSTPDGTHNASSTAKCKTAKRNVSRAKGTSEQLPTKTNSTKSPGSVSQPSPAKPSLISQVVINCDSNSVCKSEPVEDSVGLLTESGRTAEEELAHLTQWCQERLSQMTMREQVDIPTVVELLATLDAPYEVESMVQTFLGESSRTSTFVKEFLDKRRPFWQLHRERRDCEPVVDSKDQSSKNQLNGSASRSTDKKKRSGHSNGESSQTGSQSTSGWTKVRSTQTTSADLAQDNQWHHIRPKGSHSRKGRKDKTS